MERDLQSLLDMLQSAEIVSSYLQGRTQIDLETDLLLQDAVCHRLLLIGEAANRISEATQESLPKIPWRDIIGMRNRLVHEYDEIALDIVWETIVESLPELVTILREVVPPEE